MALDPVHYLQRLVLLAIWLMSAAILVSVVVSWLRAANVRVPYSNPVLRAIEELAELMLRPIRNNLPTSGGGLDFSPVVALIILQVLRTIVVRLTAVGH
ncbi:MAG: YggT family protein [Armatimonadota bacterium]